MSIGLTVVVIVVAFLAGMAVNESGHMRRRMLRDIEAAEVARRARMRLLWQQMMR